VLIVIESNMDLQTTLKKIMKMNELNVRNLEVKVHV
jgi:hypothetical protein